MIIRRSIEAKATEEIHVANGLSVFVRYINISGTIYIEINKKNDFFKMKQGERFDSKEPFHDIILRNDYDFKITIELYITEGILTAATDSIPPFFGEIPARNVATRKIGPETLPDAVAGWNTVSIEQNINRIGLELLANPNNKNDILFTRVVPTQPNDTQVTMILTKNKKYRVSYFNYPSHEFVIQYATTTGSNDLNELFVTEYFR